MDAAQELAHLLLHHDAAPGSQILERQATAFASEFLTPTTALRDELPARLDFDRLHDLKRRWGISLKALVYRGHAMGVYREHTYRRGMNLLADQQVSLDTLAAQTTLPVALVRIVIDAGSDSRPQPTISTS